MIRRAAVLMEAYLEPDGFRPVPTIGTGRDMAGSLEIPVVEGTLGF